MVAEDLVRTLRGRLRTMVEQQANDPSAGPLSVEDARTALGLPDVRLVPALLTSPFTVRSGVIVHAEAPDTLAPAVRQALEKPERRIEDAAFAVPTAEEFEALGLMAAEIAAAVRARRLVRLASDVVLLPATVQHALTVLARLPQPFTAGQAREALVTTRKVIVPLLEHLARVGSTRRVDDGHIVMPR